MKHAWTILCQNSSVDSNTNLLSIFNCLEQLVLKIDKNKAPKTDEFFIALGAQLISLWAMKNQDNDNVLEVRVEILDPVGKSLGKFDQKFEVKKGASRFRSIINIQEIKITKEGRYTVNMQQKKEGGKDFIAVAELPLDIKISYL